jgi:HTH-type transcriptional regulator/antitoxin HigA
MVKSLNIEQTIAAWQPVSRTIFVPHAEEEYQYLVDLLDSLIDLVGEDETHPLASMVDVLSVLIENYEAQHVLELEAESFSEEDSAEDLADLQAARADYAAGNYTTFDSYVAERLSRTL